LARDAMMQEISDKRKLALEQESKEILGNDDEHKEVKEADENVELKVDGRIITRPKSEVDREGGPVVMQKKLALETRLDMASRERKQLDFEKAEFAKQKAEIQRIRQQQQQARTKQDVSNKGAITKKFVESVYSGDEDEALKSFNQIISSLTPKEQEQQQVNPDQIAERVERKIAYKTSLNDGVKQLNKQYSHLVSDSRLYNMTNDATERIQREHPQWSPAKIIMEAANEVDEWVEQFRPNMNLLEERDQRKQSIDNVPTAQKKLQGEPGYKKPTAREIFEQVTKGRAN